MDTISWYQNVSILNFTDAKDDGGGGGNVLAVGNCCYVAVSSVAQGASVPTGEERGGVYYGSRPSTACFCMFSKLLMMKQLQYGT